MSHIAIDIGNGIFLLQRTCQESASDGQLSSLEQALVLTYGRLKAADAEVQRLRKALQEIADHDPEKCPHISLRDCFGLVRQIARGALA